MVIKEWDCIITRKLEIIYPEMEFQDYTDWLSDSNSGRLNPIMWGDYILTVAGEPLETVDKELIEELKIRE